MFKELEILKLQLEILTEKYDDTKTEWTTTDDEVLHYLDIASHAITKAQEKVIKTYVRKEK